ncbi:oxidoreductase [Deltaproteobacteria bacterium Smac51]|nr:oxidoreductase [Deltaproteobacteria bacterium Smac51]
MLRKDRPLVSIIGAGYWGKNLVRNFYRLGAVKSVFDASPETAANMADEFPGIETAASVEDILSDESVSGVALATPAVTHYELTKRALAAGKHVLVEKPLAMSRREGRELVDMAEKLGLVLMVDHILQNHPAYVKLRELVKAGELGRVRNIYSRRHSFGKIRQEENVLWSFAPHDVSMIIGLLNACPEKVAAFGGDWVTNGVADSVEAQLVFKDQVRATVSVSWLNPFKEHRLVVVGEKKMAVFDDTAPWPEKLKLYVHRIQWPEQRPVAEKGAAENVVIEEAEPLKAQCLDFIEAMGGEKTPVSDGREGLRVLTVLEALENSMQKGGLPQPLVDETDFFAHPTAIIDDGVTIGPGTKIWHFSHVLSGSVIGARCSLGQNVVVGPKAAIGNGVKIQNNVSVYEGVTLEDDVFCGPSMVFTNVINPRSNIVRKDEYRSTLVRRGASIGANATIVCGHTLGAWCFIGAGAVVTRNVPDYALMVGSPAVRRGWVCQCGVKLPEGLICEACGKVYEECGSGLRLKE